MKKYTCTTCGAMDSEKVNLCTPSDQAPFKEYTIDSRLAGYEALAWKVIGGHGYPTTWEEFCEEFKKEFGSTMCGDIRPKIMGRDYNSMDPADRQQFLRDDGPKKCRVPAEKAARIAASIILGD